MIDYRGKTSEWGKTLIDSLNLIIELHERLIDDVNQNTNQQFKSFREDFNNKFGSIKFTATSALTLAQ